MVWNITVIETVAQLYAMTVIQLFQQKMKAKCVMRFVRHLCIYACTLWVEQLL